MTLYRSANNKVITGLCGGIGEYLNVDPTIVRLLIVFLSFANIFFAFLAYLLISILIPTNPSSYNFENDYEKRQTGYPNNNANKKLGLVLLIVGSILLLSMVVPDFYVLFHKILRYWPVLLIATGLFLIFGKKPE